MSDEHGITERLDAVQVSRLTWDDGHLVLTEVIDTQPIDGGYSRWHCDCGETFHSIDQAEDHIQDARTGS